MFFDRSQMLTQIEPVARDERLGKTLSAAPALADRLRQILALDSPAAAHDRQALDEILELAHVAGPGISAHALERDLAELDRRPAFGLAPLHEVRNQRGQIFGALAQRRHPDRHDVETEKQVF